jgi:hypothetical protein
MQKCSVCKKNPIHLNKVCVSCAQTISNAFDVLLNQTKEMIEHLYNVQFPPPEVGVPSLDCECIGKRNIIAIDYFTTDKEHQLVICGICRRCQGYTEVPTDMKFDFFVKDSKMRGMETDNTEPFKGDYYV